MTDPNCGVAHGAPAPEVTGRVLVAVFASPVAEVLLRWAPELGFRTVLLDPDPSRGAGVVDLAAITAPTLVLAGDADPLAARPETLAAAIPGARVAVVPGDHSTALRAPAFAAVLVGFLGEAS